MWLFTRHGFFSCTCADANHAGGFEPAAKGKPSYKQPKKADLATMMIRARLKQHLLNVQAACAEMAESKAVPAIHKLSFREIAAAEVVESKTNDYRFRLVISRTAFAQLTAWLAADVDYCNFKNAVFSAEGASDYEEALHRIWSIHNGLQYGRRPARSEADLTGFGDDEGGELAEAGRG